MVFLPTAREGEKDGGEREEGDGNQKDAFGSKVQEHFEF